MSRVFLLSTNVTVEPYPVYPLGMAVLAGALTQKGHEVCQFDFLAAGRDMNRLRCELATFNPDVVGLSLRNIDNVDSFSGEKGWYLDQARDQVCAIREATRAPVVVGGGAFSILPEKILEYLGVDYGIVGEGENALCDLLDRLRAGIKIPPLIFGHGSSPGENQMGPPLYNKEVADFYIRESGQINLQTKRGCPFACVYCTYPSLEGSRVHCRDPRAVVDDLEGIRRDFPGARVFFTDSVFNDPEGRYLALIEEMVRREVGISWCGFFRPSGMGRSELALLKRSGLYALELGTDAASDATLEGLNKGFTFAEVLRFNADCLAEELPCAHFIIFGGPGETSQTVTEGLENIAALGPSVVFVFAGIRIFPGSPLCERAQNEGIIQAGQSLLKPVYYFSPTVDPRVMNERIIRSFKGLRNRIFPPSEGQMRLNVMHDFGFRGILWDRLVSFRSKGSCRRKT